MFNFSFFDPQIEYEKRSLRMATGFVGVLMLVLIVTMNITYLAIALLLNFLGFLPENGIYQDSLGLDNTTYLCLYALIYTLAMGLPLVVRLFTRYPFPKFPSKPIHSGIVYFGCIAALGICMGSNIVTNYLVAFLESIGFSSPEFPQLLEPTTTSLLLNLLVLAVLPAILEELLFRGCVLRALRPFGNGFAILVSAVLFGLMHGNIRQIPFALLVGLALGYLCVETNSLWVPMLVHFINNALSVGMEYIAFFMDDNATGWFYSYIIYGLSAMGVVALIVFFACFNRHLKQPTQSIRLSFGQRVGELFKTPSMVIALAIFILLLIVGA